MMIALRSWFGAALAAIYLIAASIFVWTEIHSVHGGFISLRGMGPVLVTAPSQATLGVLLQKLGVPKINYSSPGALGTTQLVLHLVVSAAVVYLLGAGLAALVRLIIASV
jgi:hypothetical protein